MRSSIDGIATEITKDNFVFDQSPPQFTYKLGVPQKLVEKVISNIDSYYGEKKAIKTYTDGTPKLKKGQVQERTMNPSYRELKWIQSRIKDRILDQYKYPINIQGGLKKRDNIKNAKLHLGKKFHLCSDLSRFFPSISNQMVYDRFIELGYSHDVARMITRLTTYKGKLPQGAPTSTHLSNLVYYPIDQLFISFSLEKGLFYSRFIDDITFSAQYDFKELTSKLLNIIHSSDFKINNRKTFYCEGKALITGILVANNVLDIKEAIKLKLVDPAIKDVSKKALENYRDRVRDN